VFLVRTVVARHAAHFRALTAAANVCAVGICLLEPARVDERWLTGKASSELLRPMAHGAMSSVAPRGGDIPPTFVSPVHPRRSTAPCTATDCRIAWLLLYAQRFDS
jgi:hypothetical protein